MTWYSPGNTAAVTSSQSPCFARSRDLRRWLDAIIHATLPQLLCRLVSLCSRDVCLLACSFLCLCRLRSQCLCLRLPWRPTPHWSCQMVASIYAN
ncbi:hypothetical protein FA95DRAFT_768739 [Auriscalpium vulgare]|uniref:Uncharacterized protein n=1 Tax=Auriscalpium vulgare TaxID=40419 RepID=A0ACB8RAN3_9AGAM|nr:hypothetical protein FA95DRAFT_768739 [Auriscalpium vulgare]